MGRDKEVGAHFGLLHGKNLTPHRSIWTLAILSIVIGMITVTTYLGGQRRPGGPGQAQHLVQLRDLQPRTSTPWMPELVRSSSRSISNFGTFLLYMITCIVAIVAFREHHMFNGIKHMVIPVFGLLANLLCMLFYLIGPFSVAGMSWHESYIALGVAALWGIYGLIYFASGQQGKGQGDDPDPKPA